MRSLPLLTATLLSAATPATAQVTLDLHALQALPERGGAVAPSQAAPLLTPHTGSRPQTVIPPSAASPLETHPTEGSSSAVSSSATPPPRTAEATAGSTSAPASPPPAPAAPAPPPAMPETVPQTAMITPIAPAPPPTEAPPPPPVSDKAATSAAPTVSGLRVTFAPGQSDLSPASAASIKQFAAVAPASDMTSFDVMAYAPGSPDDPSTARRISLSRAMAVRSALVADGVPSARIYVRAMGAQYGGGPPDRVDVDVQGGNAAGDGATSHAASGDARAGNATTGNATTGNATTGTTTTQATPR